MPNVTNVLITIVTELKLRKIFYGLETTFRGLYTESPTDSYLCFIFNSPSLTWRDVQYLIAYTANPLLTNMTDTQVNGAGLAVSRKFGFGVMDAEAMVTRARHWINVPPQMNDSVTPDVDSG